VIMTLPLADITTAAVTPTITTAAQSRPCPPRDPSSPMALQSVSARISLIVGDLELTTTDGRVIDSPVESEAREYRLVGDGCGTLDGFYCH